jgi:molybdopterin molybdotransferase
MRGFASRTPVEAAWRWIEQQASPLECQSVPLLQSAGRVMAAEVQSPLDVPAFDRAMMDGFAVRAEETLGATAYNPLELAILGKALPGRAFEGRVEAGQAVRIMTGAPLPAGADAVLPAEWTETAGERLRLSGEVSPGKHVGRRGEDVVAGTTVLHAGRRLRPQDAGVLASLGLEEVEVVRRPRVRIVVTGNELLPPGSAWQPHKIFDANTPMLRALVERDGGLPLSGPIVPDDPEAILSAMRGEGDLVIVSGGSSVGEEDHAPMLVARHGELAIHGIAMRPSSPTGIGKLDGRLVFLLPGNPVSCLCAYDFFAGRAIRLMGGLPAAWPYVQRRLRLNRKLASVVGRVDYARVAIVDEQVEPLAIGGASILTSTTRADGFIVVPQDSEGYPAGAEVDVWLYR